MTKFSIFCIICHLLDHTCYPLLSTKEHFGSDSDSGFKEEELPLHPAENGKPSHKEKSTADKFNDVKPESSKKPNIKLPESSKEDDNKLDEDMLGSDSSDTDDEEDRTESDEEIRKKVESAKKRSNEPASETPVPAKKAKSACPEKTDAQKGVHTATPHPAKKPIKTPANTGKPKTKRSKSGGQFSCKSCDRSFGSDKALQLHDKAKHGGK